MLYGNVREEYSRFISLFCQYTLHILRYIYCIFLIHIWLQFKIKIQIFHFDIKLHWSDFAQYLEIDWGLCRRGVYDLYSGFKLFGSKIYPLCFVYWQVCPLFCFIVLIHLLVAWRWPDQVGFKRSTFPVTTLGYSSTL